MTINLSFCSHGLKQTFMALNLPRLSSSSNIRSKNLNNRFCSQHRSENVLQTKGDIAFGDIWRHFRLHHVALRHILFRNWLILHCCLSFWCDIEHLQLQEDFLTIFLFIKISTRLKILSKSSENKFDDFGE